jgi:hypothetical protein
MSIVLCQLPEVIDEALDLAIALSLRECVCCVCVACSSTYARYCVRMCIEYPTRNLTGNKAKTRVRGLVQLVNVLLPRARSFFNQYINSLDMTGKGSCPELAAEDKK